MGTKGLPPTPHFQRIPVIVGGSWKSPVRCPCLACDQDTVQVDPSNSVLQVWTTLYWEISRGRQKNCESLDDSLEPWDSALDWLLDKGAWIGIWIKTRNCHSVDEKYSRKSSPPRLKTLKHRPGLHFLYMPTTESMHWLDAGINSLSLSWLRRRNWRKTLKISTFS